MTTVGSAAQPSAPDPGVDAVEGTVAEETAAEGIVADTVEDTSTVGFEATAVDDPAVEPVEDTVEPVETVAEDTAGEATAVEATDDPHETEPTEVAPIEATPVADTISFSIFTEKIPGKGEDAEPLLVSGDGWTWLATFDGLGGGGATRYLPADRPDEPELAVKGAYLASRQVRADLEQLVGSGDDGLLLSSIGDLGDRLRAGLASLPERYRTVSRIVSKNRRSFPTTLAMLAVEPSTGADRPAHVVWAGDSRIFQLTTSGLAQLTRDHSDPERGVIDPGLGGDAPMTRMLTAEEVDLDAFTTTVPSDAVVFSATDGCFGYFQSAFHFEHVVLSTLMSSTDVDGWRDALTAAIVAITGDDATMALVAFDCPDLATLQGRLGERARLVDTIAAAFDAGDQELVRQLWTMYRPNYEASMAPLATPSSTGPGDDDPIAAATSTTSTPTTADTSSPTAPVSLDDAPPPVGPPLAIDAPATIGVAAAIGVPEAVGVPEATDTEATTDA